MASSKRKRKSREKLGERETARQSDGLKHSEEREETADDLAKLPPLAGDLIPSVGIRIVLLVAVAAHLIALTASFLALVEPSQTHRTVLNWFAPLLRTTHFAADGRNFYLAHATPDEQVHRLQVAEAGNAADSRFVFDVATQWTTIQPGSWSRESKEETVASAGLGASDRYHRWMVTAAALSESDQPSLAAMMLVPMVQNLDNIDAVRIVRLPTQLTTAADDSAPPAYVARAVMDETQ
ncbi:MAG: hypothetical protein AAF802_28900, partial [Planctomycetota bacterium]